MAPFLSENCNVASKQKVQIQKLNDRGQISTEIDDQWESVSSFSAAKEAFYNYGTVMHFLWPYDPSPLLMLRLMHRYNWISASGDYAEFRTGLIEAFFNACLQQNANRCANGETILSYKEMEDILRNQLRSNHVPVDPPVTEKKRAKSGKSAQQTNSGQRQGSYGQKPQNSGTRNEYKTADGKLTCFRYNSVSGLTCTNKIADAAYPLCENASGAKYAHRCSAPAASGSGICGKAHRRKDHK